MTSPSFEILETRSREVACDGGGGPLGHPKVYLHIDSDDGKVTCPYCSRTYAYSPNAEAA